MSAARLVQRRRARRDVIGIVAHVADSNRAAAARLYAACERVLATLRSHPEMGRRYAPDHPSAALRGMRAVVVPGFDNYLVFTRYDGRTVEVVRVLHGARDILPLLEDEA